MFKTRWFAVTGTAAALSALAGIPASSALATPPVSDRYVARAGSQVADLSLLGRGAAFGAATVESDLETVADQLSATATGIGSSFLPGASKSVARFNDPAAPGGTSCAAPPVASVLNQAGPKLPGPSATLLPSVDVAPACGGAMVTGNSQDFVAEGTGGRTQVAVKLSKALQDLMGKATSTLDQQVLASPLGELVSPAASDPKMGQAVGTLNGLLGKIVPGVALPQLEPKQTVANLLDRLRDADLVRMDLAGSSARNVGNRSNFLSEALSQGGVLEVLPGFRGPGAKPLLRITVAESKAAVAVDRASAKTTPTLTNALVRVESELLNTLPVAGLPVVDGLVNGLPLGAVTGGQLPVVNGLLGGGLPLDNLISGLGLRSGPGYLELGPGQGISVLCDGPVSPLCSEISVDKAKEPTVLPSGITHAETSTVSVHLLKGLDTLAPAGVKLGSILGSPLLAQAVAPLAAPAGLNLGEATGVSGVRMTIGGAVAEAGGSRVAGAEAARAELPLAGPVVEPAMAGALPRTGGQPFTFAMAALLGGGIGLRTLLRRQGPSA
jgi:hypothetical protein